MENKQTMTPDDPLWVKTKVEKFSKRSYYYGMGIGYKRGMINGFCIGIYIGVLSIAIIEFIIKVLTPICLNLNK